MWSRHSRRIEPIATLDIPAHEVKNKRPIEFDIPPHIARMLIEYRGHENLKTTTNFYAGIDTRRAARHHHSLLQRETEKKATPLGRLPRKRKADRRD